jgi:hypothetical protein
MGTRTPAVQYGLKFTLLNPLTITTALTAYTAGTPYGASGFTNLGGARYVGFEAIFTYGSGGTTCKAWVQTSFDGGTTWLDVVNFAFTTASLNKVGAISAAIAAAAPATPTTQTLADNTMNNGLLGDRLRVVITTTGTYAGGTTLKIACVAK